MVSIDPAALADIPDIAALLEELDRFYGAADVEPRTLREPLIAEVLFGEDSVARALLAKDTEGHAVGLAAYSFLWPAAGVTRSLYLKELYIREGCRKMGYGRALMEKIREIASARECSRIEWTTERENRDAISFYSSLGAEIVADKVFYRLGLPG